MLGASLESDDLVSSVQVAGPFVNVTLRDDFYSRALSGYEVPMYEQKDKNVVVDYIGANIGKPLQVGHLCTPSYGQAIINLLRYR